MAVNLVLQPGVVTESVTVSSETPLLETEKSDRGTVGQCQGHGTPAGQPDDGAPNTALAGNNNVAVAPEPEGSFLDRRPICS